MLEWLSGKKTHLIAAIIGVAGVLKESGLFDGEPKILSALNVILSLGFALGLSAARAGIQKTQNAAEAASANAVAAANAAKSIQ